MAGVEYPMRSIAYLSGTFSCSKRFRPFPEEPQTGVALTPKSLARGRLVLSPQEQMALRNQAEAFLRFLEETGCPEAH